MNGTSRPETVSTKLARIAELARTAPTLVLTTLAHHIDLEFMHEAYRRIKKNRAVGVDDQTAEEFEGNLEENLQTLLNGLKTGTYKAPPVKRYYIPKDDGQQRPIGVPTLADKVMQQAVRMILEAVYEQDFSDSSHGFRPKRSCHSALKTLWHGLMNLGGGWIIDADVKGYFDTINHSHLREMLDQRVRDGVLRRMIDKWLKAGVMEDGHVTYPEDGTPQGGVISPLLANIYLHYVLDTWFEETVKPRLQGGGFLLRYADDFIIVTQYETDAQRIMAVLPKRFERFSLTIHPDKTKLSNFTRPSVKPQAADQTLAEPIPTRFDLLGFTHYWGRSRKGYPIVKRTTAAKRKRRTLQRLQAWCKASRHGNLLTQRQTLKSKLQGHYIYFGIQGNYRALREVYYQAQRLWKKWLSRRSQRANINWEEFSRILDHYPLPRPKIYHSTV